jgi:ABC-type phosphate transport system permease subunit
MKRKRISERKVILYTAGLVVLAGIVRLLNYSAGSIFFYIAFLPFMLYRLFTIIKNKQYKGTNIDLYRILILFLMILTITMNVAGWQEADFFLLFLLMIDFLLVINKRF